MKTAPYSDSHATVAVDDDMLEEHTYEYKLGLPCEPRAYAGAAFAYRAQVNNRFVSATGRPAQKIQKFTSSGHERVDKREENRVQLELARRLRFARLKHHYLDQLVVCGVLAKDHTHQLGLTWDQESDTEISRECSQS